MNTITKLDHRGSVSTVPFEFVDFVSGCSVYKMLNLIPGSANLR